LALVTPTAYLATNPPLQIVQPAASSWGDGGFVDVWLDDKCGWIYPQLFAVTERMIALASAHAQSASSERERVMRQLAREILLAQASDWPFHLRNGTAAGYASQRVCDHLTRFGQLAAGLENGNRHLVRQCEERDNLLPRLEWRHFVNCHSERGRAISSS
jgi:1,4-alpha-glucan branching enzyme